MKDLFKTLRLGVYVFALPLVITAAASAHQWLNDSSEINTQESIAVSSVSTTLATSLRSYEVGMDGQGNVHGRVISIAPNDGSAVGMGSMNVQFLRDGQLVAETVSDADGSFVVSGLSEGPYSFIATGNSGYVAHGVNVSSNSENMLLETAAVSQAIAPIHQIISTLEFNSTIADSSRATSNTPIGANRVELIDGVLNGQIVTAHNGELSPTTVHIYKDLGKVAEVVADSSGKFSISQMVPGVYDFVAAGETGFAAASFEAVNSSANVNTEATGEARVSLQDPAASTLNIILVVPVPSIPQPIQYQEDDTIGYIGDQAGYGPFYGDTGGYYGGGGGGGGFGGGGGNLIPLAALAAGIVALADDDDGVARSSTPSSLR